MTKQQAIKIIQGVPMPPYTSYAQHMACALIRKWASFSPHRFSFQHLISALIQHWGDAKKQNRPLLASHYMDIISALVAEKYGHKQTN